MKRKVMICGGGTGGHIFPGIAVAAELAERGIEVEWLGCAGGMEEDLVPRSGITLHTVTFAKPSGGFGGLAAAAYKARDAAKEARSIISAAGAGAVLGLGGYPSLPGVLAALTLKIPRIIHEQNVKFGLANRVLAPVATRVLTAFPEAAAGKGIGVGMPLRAAFAAVAPPLDRFRGRSGGLRIVVLGGSRGSLSLNAGVPTALGEAPHPPERIVHQAGKGNTEATSQSYAKAGLAEKADVREFIDDVAAELAEADLAICRAGASTIAELYSVGVGAILVPYPHANAHQEANADAAVAGDAAVKISDAHMMDPDGMSAALKKIGGRLQRAQRAQNARALAKPAAAAEVARHCEEVLNAA